MCTVTFIPVKDSVFITSNRDEKLTRRNAIPPALYEYNRHKLLFPKDADAGGTWIIFRENGDAAVLLNGAFLCHSSQPAYRKSRGILLLELMSADHISWAYYRADLSGIEPFTIILFEKGCLYEFRWDGNERFYKQLSARRSYIWSSATLYDGLAMKKREQWFASFLNRTPHPTQFDILNFHRLTGDGSKRNDLLMNRDNIYSTVSISGIMLTPDRGSMTYIDVKNNRQSEKKIELMTASEAL
jgi:uncharacterized protein with NRDE domain